MPAAALFSAASTSLLFTIHRSTPPRLRRDHPPDLVDNLPHSTAVAINAESSPPTVVCAPSTEPKKKKQKNINIRAAIIHVIGDLIQSIGVLIAAYVIKYRVRFFVFVGCVVVVVIVVVYDTGKGYSENT